MASPAPDELRERLKGCSREHLAAAAAALRPRPGGDAVIVATKTALRTLGRRVLALDEEKAALHELLAELVSVTAPELLGLHGVGVDTAATLLVTAGDNPQRLRSEAAWAHLCGVAPIEASSGKVTRYRLNRGGDRKANSALWAIVITRMRSDPRTRAYVARRLEEGRSKGEIIRVSSVTSPARCSGTSLAASTLAAAGLARYSADAPRWAVRLTICRPAAASPSLRQRLGHLGLVRVCPHPEWPTPVLPYPALRPILRKDIP